MFNISSFEKLSASHPASLQISNTSGDMFDFKELDKMQIFYDKVTINIAQLNVVSETEDDKKHVKWLFNKIKTAVDITSLTYSVQNRRTKISPTVLATPFFKLISLQKLNYIRISVDSLSFKQKRTLWIVMTENEGIRTLVLELSNSRQSVFPFLCSTSKRLKMPEFRVTATFSTRDLYLLRKYSSKWDFNLQANPVYMHIIDVFHLRYFLTFATQQRTQKGKQFLSVCLSGFHANRVLNSSFLFYVLTLLRK